MDDLTIFGECSCEEFCSRWGIAEDGSYQFWCPFIPGGGTACKHYLHGNMKQSVMSSTNNTETE